MIAIAAIALVCAALLGGLAMVLAYLRVAHLNAQHVNALSERINVLTEKVKDEATRLTQLSNRVGR